MTDGFYELEICSISPEGMNARAIGFVLPEKLRAKFAFEPGQYLTLKTELGGKEVRRSYSICSTPGDDELRVGIKKIDGGLFSTFAQTLEVGDRIEVMPPEGRFVASIGKVKRPLLIACGSGITPILSIATSLLDLDGQTEVTLLYGNRTTADIMFRESLEELKDRYMDRLLLIHVLSREDQDVELNQGRINGEKLQVMFDQGLFDHEAFDGIYLCGPQGMVDDCVAKLKENGIRDAKIHTELFTPADGGKVDENRLREIEEKVQGDVEVVAILDGASKNFAMDGKKEKVLDGAHRAGVELPYSCAGGMCCTCRCRIVEGEGEMEVNYSLEPWELEAGFTLACQTRPTTKRLILDFDAV